MSLIPNQSKYMLSGFFVKYGTIDKQTGQITVEGEFYLPYAPIAINGNHLMIKNVGILKIEDVYYIVDETPNDPQSYTQNTVLFIEGTMHYFQNPVECSGTDIKLKYFDECSQICVDLNNAYSFLQLFVAPTQNGDWTCIMNAGISNPESGSNLLYSYSYPAPIAALIGMYAVARIQDCSGNWIYSSVIHIENLQPCPPPPITTAIFISGFDMPNKSINLMVQDAYWDITIYESATQNGLYSVVYNAPLIPFPQSGPVLNYAAGQINSGSWYQASTQDINGNLVFSQKLQAP